MVRARAPQLFIVVLSAGLLVASVIGFVVRDSPAGPADGPAASGTVTIVDISFDPSEITVAVGDTVTWTNKDGATHTVTSDGDGPLASGDLETGATYEASFERPGSYAYVCTIHPNMQATVEVTG